MAVAQHIPAKRNGRQSDMAAAAIYLASAASDYVVGRTLVVDGGMNNARGYSANAGRAKVTHRRGAFVGSVTVFSAPQWRSNFCITPATNRLLRVHPAVIKMQPGPPTSGDFA